MSSAMRHQLDDADASGCLEAAGGKVTACDAVDVECIALIWYGKTGNASRGRYKGPDTGKSAQHRGSCEEMGQEVA